VEISDAVLSQLKEGQKPESPGMKYKHYAPDARVVLVKGKVENVKRLLAEKYKNSNTGIICYDEDIDACDSRVIKVGSRRDNSLYAEKMFDSLRSMDKIKGIDTIFACLPEDTKGISLAIYNRMLRAAAFYVVNADDAVKEGE